MLEVYELDPYFEMVAQRHEARLIVTDADTNEVRKPVKRDCLKYLKECRGKLKKTYRWER
ncbi:hypothetical protein AAGS61_01605 [Lysinibacillus sp. KU-BSD001]|uniref:hypothetical protein n=1 Tax=Lysinibacillus sp. KU-BSD001 TaxID=3141328 RepID=UPI0036EEC5F1